MAQLQPGQTCLEVGAARKNEFGVDAQSANAGLVFVRIRKRDRATLDHRIKVHGETALLRDLPGTQSLGVRLARWLCIFGICPDPERTNPLGFQVFSAGAAAVTAMASCASMPSRREGRATPRQVSLRVTPDADRRARQACDPKPASPIEPLADTLKKTTIA